MHFSMHYFMTTEREDHTALDFLIARIKKLAPMARVKNLDEEAKTCFLREAVAGTEWSLRASINLTGLLSYQ